MNMKQDNRTALLQGNTWKVMISLSFPAIVGMLVIGLYNFMDAVFVGNMLGSVAMTAVKVSYPFTLINSGIATLFGVGSASVLSRAVGKKDQKTIDCIMGNLIFGIVILSIGVTVCGILFAKQLLMLTGAEGECMHLAIGYLRIVFAGSLFINFAQAANMVMRGEGMLKKAMLIMGGGALINIILDPILIYAMNSVDGAAYATIIAQMVQAGLTLHYFLKQSKNVKIHKIGFRREVMSEVLAVGASAMLMQILQMVQQTVMYSVAQKWGGAEWQTILGAALSLQAFSFIPLWGISQGFQPAAGTNYGAKQYDRVKKFMFVFSIAASILSLAFYLPVILRPETMLEMFIPDAPNIIAMGAGMLRLLFVTYISYGFVIMSITLFQSLGKASKAAMITLLRSAVIFIPMVLWLPEINNFGVQGLFLAPVLTDIIVLLITVFMVIRTLRKIAEGS